MAAAANTMMLLFVIFASVLVPALSDTPANCTFEDIQGKWVFSIGSGGNDRSVSCNNFTGLLRNALVLDSTVMASLIYGVFPDLVTGVFCDS